MDVLHELGLLLVQARSYEDAGAHPDNLLSERIAALRSVMLRDKIAASATSIPAHSHTRKSRLARQSVILHGRLVDMPAVAVQLAQILEANNERPMLGRDIAARLDGHPCKETVHDRTARLKAALFHANCGLSIHVSHSEGYALIAEPITMAQRIEAAS